MIALLFVVGVIVLAFTIACAWADSRPPIEPEPAEDISHVRVVRIVKDQEHNA